MFVLVAYSASSAAPSASTTLLVSSLDICRASARCMSVMVQNDATRWSRHRAGDVTGQKQEMCSAAFYSGYMHLKQGSATH